MARRTQQSKRKRPRPIRKPMPPPCVTGKAVYVGVNDAKAGAQRFVKKLRYRGQEPETLYTYTCNRCGWLHLTRQGREGSLMVYYVGPKVTYRPPSLG